MQHPPLAIQVGQGGEAPQHRLLVVRLQAAPVLRAPVQALQAQRSERRQLLRQLLQMERIEAGQRVALQLRVVVAGASCD